MSDSLQWPETEFPPYSRAAATAYLAKEKIHQLTVFPSAKSAVIVVGQCPLWLTCFAAAAAPQR
jgi:hypothetical protein